MVGRRALSRAMQPAATSLFDAFLFLGLKKYRPPERMSYFAGFKGKCRIKLQCLFKLLPAQCRATDETIAEGRIFQCIQLKILVNLQVIEHGCRTLDCPVVITIVVQADNAVAFRLCSCPSRLFSNLFRCLWRRSRREGLCRRCGFRRRLRRLDLDLFRLAGCQKGNRQYCTDYSAWIS